MSPEAWAVWCPVLWFGRPGGTQCAKMRCAACAPVVMAASRVCQQGDMRDVRATARGHRCMQDVMQEGFCNFCIADYMM